MIYERIQNDKLERLKQGGDRALLSLIMGEICVDGKPMDDDKAVKRLTQMVKTCDKNIELYKKAGKNEKSLEEATFRGIIMSYLPEPASQEDIEMCLASLDLPRTMKSMGEVMKNLKSVFQVVDGNLVKEVLMGKR